jgi:hypothetical protein
MKEYHSINGPSKAPHLPCYGFLKIDGSNIRCGWTRKKGWHKFGTRKRMIDHTDPVFGRAIPLFLEKFGDDLEKIFKKEKLFHGIREVVVFSEFFGSKSFAGMHFPDETQWNIVPFDVNPVGKGIISPKEFLDHFGHLKVAELVYQGNMGEQLVQDVRKENFSLESSYEIKTEVPEGIICKGIQKINNCYWMCKIKTERYKAELKTRYEFDWLKYWGIEDY